MLKRKQRVAIDDNQCVAFTLPTVFLELHSFTN